MSFLRRAVLTGKMLANPFYCNLGKGPLIPVAPPGGAMRFSPVLARITGENSSGRPGVGCKIAAKNKENQSTTPLGHGAAKGREQGSEKAITAAPKAITGE
jgi:hypothetical protein